VVFKDENIPLDTGQAKPMVQTITAVGQTLKVTLAWTDPSARGSPAVTHSITIA